MDTISVSTVEELIEILKKYKPKSSVVAIREGIFKSFYLYEAIENQIVFDVYT